MKQANPLLFIVYLLAFNASCQESNTSNLALLSNQTPTDSALIFAPGIIATDAFEFAITLNPEMDELFFTRRKPEANNEIYTMRLVNGRWSEPEVAFFKAEEGWDFEPHINPQGDRLYFGSLRALPNTAKGTGLHQWYSEKTQQGWSEPLPLGKPFVDRIVMYLTSARNGNLYFTSWTREEGEIKDNGIYQSINEEGTYGSVNKMGKEINLPGLKSIAHPYIAPDESYIIFDGKSDTIGYGNCDLYISFNTNGVWTEAQNLGPLVNTELCEFTASVSPDGKYLFFHRGIVSDDEETGNIYWIAFETIKEHMKQ
jgi:Tol biopolymer transport system component